MSTRAGRGARFAGEAVLLQMHVAKTAGQSLNAAMAERHRGRIAGVTEPAMLRRFEALSQAERDRRYDVVRGHLVTWGFDAFFDRPSLYVSSMREPIARICSLFNYVHTRPSHSRHALFKRRYRSMDDFGPDDLKLAWVKNYFVNVYYQFYAAIDLRVSQIPAGEVDGTLATLVEAAQSGRFVVGPLDHVAARLAAMGRLDLPLPRENPTVVAAEPDFVPARPDTLSSSARALFEDANAVDLALYRALRQTWAAPA